MAFRQHSPKTFQVSQTAIHNMELVPEILRCLMCLALAHIALSIIPSHPKSENPLTAPPTGNHIILRVKGRGYQQYACNASMSWQNVQAWAELFPVTEQEVNVSKRIGFHYFLPYPDASGGRPTWSLFASAGALETAQPESTITGKVVVRAPQTGNIDSLLVQATSQSGSGQISYVQRIPKTGGLPPAAPLCGQPGRIQNVDYESEYVFWGQDKHSEAGKIREIKALSTYFGEGLQHYTYNGSAWVLTNATAVLSTLPGREVVGRHYFLQEKDTKGGQPTWETFSPSSVVTGKVVNKTVVDTNSIPWLDLQTTCSRGDPHVLASATTIQRLSTRAGLPPSIPGTMGQIYSSPYSAVYWFYA